jgi:MOSC domain-containing protein YiiM
MSPTSGDTTPRVQAVHLDARHRFSKQPVPAIELVAGLGVRGDAHFGATVQHRSRVRRDPGQPNLRQVHLLAGELLNGLEARRLTVLPGQMGENITTRGIDLLGLSPGTRLRLGADAVVELTGLRNPCAQIEAFQTGLLAAVLDQAPDGSLIRKAGVMCTVVEGGAVAAGDAIEVIHRPTGNRPLEPV